jgi:hypothetical protein
MQRAAVGHAGDGATGRRGDGATGRRGDGATGRRIITSGPHAGLPHTRGTAWPMVERAHGVGVYDGLPWFDALFIRHLPSTHQNGIETFHSASSAS